MSAREIIPYDEEYEKISNWFKLTVIILILSTTSAFIAGGLLSFEMISHPLSNLLMAICIPIALCTTTILASFSDHKTYRNTSIFFTLREDGKIKCYSELPISLTSCIIELNLRNPKKSFIRHSDGAFWTELFNKIKVTKLDGNNTQIFVSSPKIKNAELPTSISQLLKFLQGMYGKDLNGDKISVNPEFNLYDILFSINTKNDIAIHMQDELDRRRSEKTYYILTYVSQLLSIVKEVVNLKQNSDPAKRIREAMELTFKSLPPSLLASILIEAERVLPEDEASQTAFHELQTRLTT